MAGDQTSFLPISSPDSPTVAQPLPSHPPAPRGPVRTESEASRAGALRDRFSSRETELRDVEQSQSVPLGCMITITSSEQYRSDLQAATQNLREAESALAGDSPDGSLAIIHLADAHAAIDGLQQSMGCHQDPVVTRLMERYFLLLARTPEATQTDTGDALMSQLDHFQVERADGGMREFRDGNGVVTVMDMDSIPMQTFQEVHPTRTVPQRIE